MKYFNDSEAYDGSKTFSQSYFSTYESLNTCVYVGTSCLYYDLVFLSILNFSTETLIYISINCYYSQVT